LIEKLLLVLLTLILILVCDAGSEIIGLSRSFDRSFDPGQLQRKRALILTQQAESRRRELSACC
jgi:hypothetical protein